MTGLSDPKSRLIFALDVPSLDEAVSFVQKLDGSVGMFKVGLELFIKEGPAVLTAIPPLLKEPFNPPLPTRFVS